MPPVSQIIQTGANTIKKFNEKYLLAYGLIYFVIYKSSISAHSSKALWTIIFGNKTTYVILDVLFTTGCKDILFILITRSEMSCFHAHLESKNLCSTVTYSLYGKQFLNVEEILVMKLSYFKTVI